MKNDMESSWSMENYMTVMTKFDPTIEFVLKNNKNLLFSTDMYVKSVVDQDCSCCLEDVPGVHK